MKKKLPHPPLTNVEITKLGHGGVGIGILPNSKKVLVAGGVTPGMLIDARVTKKKRDYIEATATRLCNPEKIDGIKEPACKHCFVPFLEYGKIEELKNGKVKGNGNEEANNNPQTREPINSQTSRGCGGCKRQHLSYAIQCDLKMKIVADSFRVCPDVWAKAKIHDIVPAPSELQYRNKIEFSFGKYISKVHSYKDTEIHSYRDTQTGNNETIELCNHETINEHRNLGFHKQGQFSKVIDIEQCLLISPKAHDIFSYIKNLCKSSGLPVHDQKTHEGFFRHLVIREGINTGQILVNLVIAAEQLKMENGKWKMGRDTLVKTFLADERLRSQITSFCVTTNDGLADIVKSQDAHMEVLRGDGHIYDSLNLMKNAKGNEVPYNEEKGIINNKTQQDGNNETIELSNYVTIQFRISPFSFFQTNTKGAELLFGTASKHIGDVTGTILDLYCGTGSIGLSLLAQGKGDFVIGIEINPDAIVDARHNASSNNVADKTYFVAGKAETLVHTDSLVKEKMQDIGLLVVDPPRDGLHKDVIRFLCEAKQSYTCKLLYISCNPVTMARDVALLAEGGRKLDILQPVDMFPQTHHIETIGVLQ